MFGQGNPVPQPGASLRQPPPGAPQPFLQGNPAPRPGGSLQQLPSGAPQPFQQGGHGCSGPGRHVMQNLRYQSAPHVYHNALMTHSQSGARNVGMYVHGSQQHNIGSNQGPYYSHFQHYSQRHPQNGVQNLYHVPPARSSLPPPPPPPLLPASHGLRCSESLIPPPPSGYIMQRGVGQPTQSSGHHGVQHFQQPQQPLLTSVVHRITQSETSPLATENDSHLVFSSPPPLPLLQSCASPVPPACPPSGLPVSHGKELTLAVFNAASESPSPLRWPGGCPDPVKTNDVEATNELTLTSHNKESSVTVDGLCNESKTCVSMVNASSGMNNKSELLGPEAGSASQCNSSTGGNLCSTSDSDMDMEDDILKLVEDLETNESEKDQNHENLAQAENLDGKQKLHGHILTPASSTCLPGEGVICGNFLGVPSSMKTPIEVKQGYASDDYIEKLCANNVKEDSHAQPATDESTVLKKVGEPNIVSDGGSNNHCTAYEESNLIILEHSLIQKKLAEFRKETEMNLKNSSMTSVSVSIPSDVTKRDGSKEYLCDESQHPSQAKGRLKPDDMTYKHGKPHADSEDTTASLQLKVDEFGRLAKNVSSDSDSDDRHYSRKRGRRGRSRSISPLERRRKTHLRRRYNRSISRSHSLLRRRSRSRSPGHRRPTESISDSRRRDKIRTSICFNFRDGKCHRGSSCRFLHHESYKSGSSNSYKRKRLSEAALGDGGSNLQERSKESLGEKGSHRDGKEESHEAHQLSNTKGVPDSGRVNDVTNKNDVGQGMTVIDRAELDQDDHRMGSYSNKCEDIGGETAHVVEVSMPQVAQGQNVTNLPGDNKYQKSALTWHPCDANGLPSLVNTSTSFSSRSRELEVKHSVAVPQYANLQPQKSHISYGSLSGQHQSLGTPHLLKTCDPCQDSVQPPSLSCATTELGIQPVVAENPSWQVPFGVIVTPSSQTTTGNRMPQLPSNLSSMETSTCLPPVFIPGGGPSYNQLSLHNQPPQYNQRPVPLWNSVPPPLPRASIHADTSKANSSTSVNTIPYHFEQNQQSQRTAVVLQSISVPYSGHMHFNSQYGGNHHYNYHPSAEAHRPPFALRTQTPDSLFIANSLPHRTEGLHFERNDQTSVQVVIPSTFHVQPSTSFVRPPATGTLPSSDSAFHVSSQSNTIFNSTSLNDPRNSMSSDSRILGFPGKIGSTTFITSSANLGVSSISGFEHSTTSAHCNMHVPASDRPLASSSQPQMVGAQGSEAHVLREKSPSSISIRNTGQSFPESGGGQYDPLLDSPDKSPNSLVNSERAMKQRSTSDSDNMLRESVSRKPLDVEETNRRNENEAIASLTSSDNEEFGETADAEAGPLENESVNNLVVIPSRDSEVAISETYPAKKSKDSRSMKLFKSAIANFVKEVLKPSWRQGNMSKEAFKTIVKKTVEKVSGAMKGHRYPTSHAKINHYIDSSERKLRKLVMGYMDKYVKV